MRTPSTALLLSLLVLAATAAAAEPQPPSPPPPAPAPAPAPASADVPFSLALEAFAVEGYPGLHSFAHGGDPSALVLLAGRTNGLHGFQPSVEAAEFPSFPREFANDTAYVLDLAAGKLLGQAKVTGLPSPYAQQLVASNTQWLEDGGWLYVVGGYGPDTEPPHGLVTLPWLTVIDREALVRTVTSGAPLDEAFARAHMASVQHPALAITGGDLQLVGGKLLLAFGHQFDGEYTPGGGQAFQEYSNSVRVFTAAASRGEGGAVEVDLQFLGTVPENTNRPPDNPYHRRDLTVKGALDPSGSPRVGVYGGVFKGGRQEGYVHPLYVTAGSGGGAGCVSGQGIAICEDTAATQLLSQYDCGAVQLYSASAGAMYSTFFGGISGYYWDPECSCLKEDQVDVFGKGVDSLPFIDSVSTFRVTAAGSAQFLHQGLTFPPAGRAPSCPDGSGGTVAAAYLGAETKFVPAAGVPASGGVLLLDRISERTVIGYLVGGIAAACPGDPPNCYASTKGTTCASSLVYRVTLDPKTPSRTVRLEAPAE
jgi:hypothetical protein